MACGRNFAAAFKDLSWYMRSQTKPSMPVRSANFRSNSTTSDGTLRSMSSTSPFFTWASNCGKIRKQYRPSLIGESEILNDKLPIKPHLLLKKRLDHEDELSSIFLPWSFVFCFLFEFVLHLSLSFLVWSSPHLCSGTWATGARSSSTPAAPPRPLSSSARFCNFNTSLWSSSFSRYNSIKGYI